MRLHESVSVEKKTREEEREREMRGEGKYSDHIQESEAVSMSTLTKLQGKKNMTILVNGEYS